MMRSTARSSNRSPTTLTSEYQHCQLLCVHSWRGTIYLTAWTLGPGERLPPNDVLSPASQMLGLLLSTLEI